MKIIHWLLIIVFCFTSIVPPNVCAQAGVLSTPGQMAGLSVPFAPAILKGIKVYPDDPLRFDFILDPGNQDSVETLHATSLQDDAVRLIRYFMASLTIPEKDLWVNLSPYEQTRVITPEFSQTEMGRDLLTQDYLLKQITASVIYPEGEIGKKFWARVYEAAYEKYGTTDIPIDTFNKVWITPDKVVVYENGTRAFVTNATLKVMLEADYIAQANNVVGADFMSARNRAEINSAPTTEFTKSIIREIVLPILEKEVNEGANFATLRQVYQSLILAAWFKKKIKESLLSKVYVDQKKVAGVNIDDPDMANKIWAQYVEAFKKGAFNYIKEECDENTRKIIPRKYFSGGVDCSSLSGVSLEIIHDAGQIKENPQYFEVESGIKEVGSSDAAEVVFPPLDAPVPDDIPVFDHAKAQAWVDKERHPVLQSAKQKIVDHVRHVSFQEFQEALGKTVEKLNETLGDVPYAVLWDNDSASSKRWVYELAREKLAHKAKAETYFWSKIESPAGFPTLQKMIEQGITTFVIMDDASYTGSQIRSVLINPVVQYFNMRNQADPGFKIKPRFIVAVPFISTAARERINGLKSYGVDVQIVSSEYMPSQQELLSEPEIRAMKFEIQDLGAMITFFDHMVADGYSFSDDMTAFFVTEGEKPYRSGTAYAEEEEKQFDRYKGSILRQQRWHGDSAQINGGIDLNSERMDLQVENAGDGIKFDFDPAMITHLEASPGFSPVVIDIKPLASIRNFLGINN